MYCYRRNDQKPGKSYNERHTVVSSKLNQTKNILIAVLVTNLCCTFFGGHGGAPLLLVELIALHSAITLNFDEFPLLSFWTLAAVFLLAGQIIILIGIRKKNGRYTVLSGRIGITLLILSLATIAWGKPGDFWIAAFISSSPFLTLTIIFLWKTRNKMQLAQST